MNCKLNTNISVMVIDDDLFILSLTNRILKSMGIEKVVQASNGRAALDLISNGHTELDVIISDLNMPEVDGIEFLRLVKDTSFKGSMILVSGEDKGIIRSALDLAKAHEINVLGAIPKPLRRSSFEELFSRLAESRDAGNESRDTGKKSVEEPLSYSELWAELQTPNSRCIQLYFQPQVHLASGKIKRAEALVRWDHRDRGILGPGAFIPLAEKWELIDSLSSVVFEKAMKRAAEWTVSGLDLGVSVNFSVNSFCIDDFLGFIHNKALEHGVDPGRVTLEITESQVMNDYKSCAERTTRLRLHKFGLSIDDFGKGNSTLEQLKKLPFTELKIDRDVVHGASEDESMRAILESSIDLAKKLDMTIVAEGVETREDWDLVAELGCDYAQGYYCAPPMSNSEFLEFVCRWNGVANDMGKFTKTGKEATSSHPDKTDNQPGSVVIINLNNAQPLVDAYRDVRYLNRNGQKHINIMVEGEHGELESRFVFNELTSICKDFLDLELKFLGRVPEHLPGWRLGEVSAAQINNVVTFLQSGKVRGNLDHLKDYWSKKNPVLLPSEED